jgi:hypothetical protein
MELVNDLGNDVVVEMLVKKKHSEKIESGDILPLISKIREALEPISSRDHSYTNETEEVADVMTKSH